METFSALLAVCDGNPPVTDGFPSQSKSKSKSESESESESESKSKNTLFNVGQCKQYNMSSHLKWVLVVDNSMHMIIYNKIHIKNVP